MHIQRHDFTKRRLPARHTQPVIGNHQTQAVRRTFLRRKAALVASAFIGFIVIFTAVELHVLHDMRGVDDSDLFIGIKGYPAPLHATGAVRVGQRTLAFGGRRRVHSLIGQVIPQAGTLPGTDHIGQLPDLWFFRLIEQRRGFGREWLGWRKHFPLHRTVTLRYRTLFDRPDILPRQAVNHKQEALLGGLNQGRDLFAVYGDIHQRWGGVDIVIPHVVMHPLARPDHFTGIDIQRRCRGAKRDLLYTIAAPVVRRWR